MAQDNGAAPTTADPIRVFIGYDPRQVIAYTILTRSIIARTTRRVSIEPLMIDTLPITRVGLTPFTWSRFLVPWMCDYQGWAIFLDVDQLVLDDIAELWDMQDERFAVMAVKNRLRFEWASVMLFNCAQCRALTPEFVQTTDKALHKLDGWIDEAQVGALPAEWNHLVGYDEPREDAKLVHFTQGIPIFAETQGSEYGAHYQAEAQSAMASQPWATLMAQSVHAQPVYARLAREMKPPTLAEG